MEPHSPYDTPPAAPRPFVDPDYEGPVTGAHGELDAVLRGNYTLQGGDLKQVLDLYDQALLSLDTAIGGLLSELEQRGLKENTVVVFLSDHGEEFMDHGKLLHGYTVYEEQLHVPLVIRAPGLKPDVVDRVTRQGDVLPTLLDLLGLVRPSTLQGESLLGESREIDPPVYASTQLRAVWTARAQSFQSGGWKYLRTELPEAGEARYHLAEDPGETKDLRASSPKRTRELRLAMETLVGDLPAAAGARVQLTEEELQSLRALGYVEH